MQHLFFYIAGASVLLGMLSAILIAVDLVRRPQPMRIMNAVWILTGLWASLFALAAYYTFGRTPKMPDMEMDMPNNMEMKGMDMKMEIHGMKPGSMPDMEMKMADMKGMDMKMEMPTRPKWQGLVLSTLHCGAGCTLADISGEWFMFFIPISIGGSLIAGTWVTQYLLALLIGVGFQYAAIRDMERIAPGKALVRAAKADFFSLTAWQAGMYAWLAFVIFGMEGGTPLPRTTFSFWFMMQVAMGVGFLLALPVNALLIRAGIKKGM